MGVSSIQKFLDKTAQLLVRELPLFIMLVIYATAPTFFSCAYSLKTCILIVLPQVILPSMLLCLVASWRRWSWWIVFVFANLLWMMEMGCFFIQGERLNSYIGILIAQSNPKESGEYLSTIYVKMLETAIATAVSVILFYICDHVWRRHSGHIIERLQSSLHRNLIMRCAGVILVMSVVYSPIAIYAVAGKVNYSDRIIRPWILSNTASTWILYVYTFNDTFNNPSFKALPQLVETLSSTEVTLDGPTDSLTVVYVIGESFPRCRSSLFGYDLDTNPMLGKEHADSSLMIFDNVISRWHYTSGVYRAMLSTYDVQDDRTFECYPLLPALMKKAGYKVAYLDNQKSIAHGVGDVDCTYFLANDKIRDYCFDFYNDAIEAYDGDFVNKYASSYMDCSGNTLTIFHLMGQHNTYRDRYPEGFAHFTKSDYEHFDGLSKRGAVTMAEFDNATLYNDYVMHTLIEKLRDKTAILIYSPDHGEEAYDYREVGMRGIEAPIASVRLYYEVPVMIWLSDSFRQKYPGIVSALRSNTHKAIYNSDLPQTILDIAGIRTTTFNPDVSLLRGGTGRSHRHVQINDIDYDAMHDEIYRQKYRYEQWHQ